MMLTHAERQQIYARHFEQYQARHCAALFQADEFADEFIEDCARECRDEQIGRGLKAISVVGGWALVLGSCGAFWWYVITHVATWIS